MVIHLNSSLKVNCEVYNAPEGLCILQKDAATHVILKAIVYTFREVTLSVSFDSFQKKGSTLYRKKFFLLRVYPFLKGSHHLRKQTEIRKNYSPL